MKIRKIKLENNPVFGNIEFDFCDKNGNVADTIILAGENGCGKTTLLDIIYDFSVFSNQNFADGEKRVFDFEIGEEYLKTIEKVLNRPPHKPIDLSDRFVATISNDVSWRGNFAYVDITDGNLKALEQNDNIHISNALNSTGELSSIFKAVYSTTEINYTPKQSSSVTSKELDSPVQRSIRSNSTDLATEIQQLLIDVQNNDAVELNDWVRVNPGSVPPEENVDKRIKRFKNAFAEIFIDLNYKTIKTDGGKKEVLFERHNIQIPISKLSSGEKQIVFRGAFLLKDKESITGSVVLIDEPEISLHPVWQENILDYYRKLFVNSNGIQQSQLFISTHSPYIIHSNTRVNDKIVVLKKNLRGIIVDDNPEFASIGVNKAIKEAFNTNWFDTEMPLIITEGCTDWKHMKAAYTKLMEDPTFAEEFSDINFGFLEYEPKNSKKESKLKLQMSNTELVTMCKSVSNVMQKQKLIFIADCDAKKDTKDLVSEGEDYKSWGNNVFSLELPVPNHRAETPNICIEHYYTDDEIKTEYTDGEFTRRIYMGNEFNSNGYNPNLQLKCDAKDIYGEKSITILDGSHYGKIYRLEDEERKNYGLSKNNFAEKILHNEELFNSMNFSNFIELFKIIKNIIVNN